jgi:hypothetical protein
MALGDGAFAMKLDHEVRALMNGLVLSLKRALSPLRPFENKAWSLGHELDPHKVPNSVSSLIMGFLVPRMGKNNSVIYKLSSLWYLITAS